VGRTMERDGESSVSDLANYHEAIKGIRLHDERNRGMNPSSNPSFDAKREHTIYYMSHPLAPDERFTFDENMAHVVHLMRIFYEEGWMVIAPYHTICLALPDSNDEFRRLGLECDCNMTRMMGNMVMTGHKISSGMRNEMEQAMACKRGGIIHNFVGYNDDELRAALRFLRNGGSLESDTVQAPV
jgi:hypothetical protein